MKWLRNARFVLLALFCFPPGHGVAQTSSTDDLSRSSLEDLAQMKISVTSFARKTADVDATPAAVYVITREQIEQSAASNIPDLLRIVPGIQVAQINSYTWAVTARGFNNQYANKLLVLVDGRTVYSEVSAGVTWDEVFVPLSDIDRIEVIRGPGAAVWGTNAVNGVINIITRPARQVLGSEIVADASNATQHVTLRYGGSLTQHSEFSLDLSGIHFRPFHDETGQEAFDGENQLRLRGRVEWHPSATNTFIGTGDIYRGHFHAELNANPASSIDQLDRGWLDGGFALARWEHNTPQAQSSLQAYYSRQQRTELHNDGLSNTFDLDALTRRHAGPRHDLVMGFGLSFNIDNVAPIAGADILFARSEDNLHLASAFVQDEITLVPHRLMATLGTKLQEGSLAGFQAQPSVRLLWSPHEGHTLFAAASHAAVASSITEISFNSDMLLGTNNGLPIISTLRGNPAIKPEFVDAYELGYRTHLTPALWAELDGFYNLNARITAVQTGAPQLSTSSPPAIDVPSTYVNGYRANTQGAEFSITWNATRSLNVSAAYTWMQAHGEQTLPGKVTIVDSWSSPRNSGSLTAAWALPHGWRLNSFFQYVQALSDTSSTFHGVTPGQWVPSYERFDLHLSQHIAHHLELDAGATNLFEPHHLEFGGNSGVSRCFEVPRTFYGKAKVTF